jgi:hypothetical protein
MRHDTEPQSLPLGTDPSDEAPLASPSRQDARYERSSHGHRALNETDPGWPPGTVGGPGRGNDTEPGLAPVEALDATLEGFRRRPRVEIEEVLETNGADAARGHVHAHVPPRRGDANDPSRRVIVEDLSTPSTSVASAAPAAPQANVAEPMVVPAPAAFATEAASSPAPTKSTQEVRARMASTVKGPPMRPTLSLPVLAALGGLLVVGTVSVLLSLRGGSGTHASSRNAPSAATATTGPSLPSTTTASPPSTGAVAPSSDSASHAGSPLSPTSASAQATSPVVKPEPTPVRTNDSPPAGRVRPSAGGSSPSSPTPSPVPSTTSAQPRHSSPASDILRNQ